MRVVRSAGCHPMSKTDSAAVCVGDKILVMGGRRAYLSVDDVEIATITTQHVAEYVGLHV